MKRSRRVIAAVLAVVMILAPISSAFAAGADGWSYKYAAFGDSITAGTGTDASAGKATTDLEKNYKDSPEDCYPYLVAEDLTSYLKAAGYSDLDTDYDWSNLGVGSNRTIDVIGYLTVPGYTNSLEESLGKNTWQSLIQSELSTADTITLNVGGNDLFTNLISIIGTKGYGTDGKEVVWQRDPEGEPETFYQVGDDGNVILYLMVLYIRGTYMSDDPSAGLTQVLANLDFYTNSDSPCTRKLSVKDITETLRMFSYDELKAILDELSKGNTEHIDEAVLALINAEPDAAVALIGNYYPYGNSLVLDGETRNLPYVLRAILQKIKRVVLYGEDVMDTEELEADLQAAADVDEDELVAEAEAAADDTMVTQEAEDLMATAEVLDDLQTMTCDETAGCTKCWNGLAGFIAWTHENYENLKDFSTDVRNAWIETASWLNEHAEEIEALADICSKYAEEIAKDKNVLTKKLVEVTGKAKDEIIIFLEEFYEHYGEFLGTKEEYQAIGDHLKDYWLEWTVVFAKFLVSSGEQKSEVLDTLIDSMVYPLTYFFAGKPSYDAFTSMNAAMEATAEKYGLLYVDLSDLPNVQRLDPHPGTVGHAMIREKVTAALTFNGEDVITAQGDANGTIAGPTKAVYGVDAVFTATPAKGYQLASVTVNGEKLEGVKAGDTEFVVEKITGETNVQATFEAISSGKNVSTGVFDDYWTLIAIFALLAIGCVAFVVTVRKRKGNE